jgi:hypothetical protein
MLIPFYRLRTCSQAVCIRKGWHSFTSSYANAFQAPYLKFENVEQGSKKAIGLR